MKDINNSLKKVCSFYVSDWHLTVMLLSFVENEMDKRNSIITFLEKELEGNVNNLLSRINIKEKSRNKIKNISWKSNNSLEYTQIEKKLKNESVIIVRGKSEYIEKVNNNIEKYLKSSKGKRLKVVNCYELSDNKQNMEEILNKHDKVLNSSGEREIGEVFGEYNSIHKNVING